MADLQMNCFFGVVSSLLLSLPLVPDTGWRRASHWKEGKCATCLGTRSRPRCGAVPSSSGLCCTLNPCFKLV
ncbi:hypothetical protein B0T10DRAFT_167677 [Thelonectria olida]|uniref:Beta-defensin n=1 Tax=Thelonectria olida TaxID=1576542 RepID=A0A9P8WE90_9HYPO|nr:hypothetical protein B0T10DRAFT_167677 [Thelonectria olida]